MKIEKILEKLISFNTVKDKENGEINKWIAEFLLNLGFQVEYLVDSNSDKANLFAFIGDNDPGLIFMGHTDTVPSSLAWKKNPFKLDIDGDKLYGLGACDMKGGIAAILATLQNLQLDKSLQKVGVLFTYDEEVGFGGIKKFVKDRKIQDKFFVIAEPSSLSPIVFTKGVLAYQFSIYGKSVHGSEVNKGDNAIYFAMKIIDKLKAIKDNFSLEQNERFKSGDSFNLGIIKGGRAVNMVPDFCQFEFEFRVTSKENQKIIEEEINILSSLENIEIKQTLQLSPMIANDKKVNTILEKVTGKKISSANYATEGSCIKESYPDSQIVILGPGPNNPHESDEYVSKKSLYKVVKMYEELIKFYHY